MDKPNYKKTLRACYLGFITQAICANFAPLLFLTFHKNYQISLGLIALIPVAFFFTQLVVDIFCAKFVDKIGYRVSIRSILSSGINQPCLPARNLSTRKSFYRNHDKRNPLCNRKRTNRSTLFANSRSMSV